MSLRETREDLINLYGATPTLTWKWAERPNGSAWLRNAEHNIYRITEESIDFLDKLFTYLTLNTIGIFKIIKIMMNLLFFEAVDNFKQEGDNVEEKAGEYKYYPTTPFKESDAPDNYIKGSYKESDENRYGEILLSFPTPLIYRPQFKIVPADLTELEGVKAILNQISNDAEKEQYIKMVKEANNFTDIAIFTQRMLVFPEICIRKCRHL